MQVNMLEAKNQLSKLVKAAQAGEEVVIANHGTPIVRLVAVDAAKPVRKPGGWLDAKALDSDWDSPEVNQQIAALFDASEIFPPESNPGESNPGESNPGVSNLPETHPDAQR